MNNYKSIIEKNTVSDVNYSYKILIVEDDENQQNAIINLITQEEIVQLSV